MWADLPYSYRARRPRPVTIHDHSGLGNYNAGWLIEGSLEPHALGPGAQQANTPRNVLVEFGADTNREHCSVGSMTLADPQARLGDMDRMGFDAQMLFPSTLYAHMTADPGFEAALFRAYNRFVAGQCKHDPSRLKWSGLLPLRDQRQSFEAIDEMQRLGARAAVVFGAGDRIYQPDFCRSGFARAKLPLCSHGMAIASPSSTARSTTAMSSACPYRSARLRSYRRLACSAAIGPKWRFLNSARSGSSHGMRMDHYLPIDRRSSVRLSMPNAAELPRTSIRAYVKSEIFGCRLTMDDHSSSTHWRRLRAVLIHFPRGDRTTPEMSTRGCQIQKLL
jgi:hypothetical protein